MESNELPPACAKKAERNQRGDAAKAMALRLTEEVAGEDRDPAGGPPPFPPDWRDQGVLPCGWPGWLTGGRGVGEA